MAVCYIYLIASRSDISLSVGVCAWFHTNPKISHLNIVKHTIKYIIGTYEYDIWYISYSDTNIVGLSDVDWTGKVEDRKKHHTDVSTKKVI